MNNRKLNRRPLSLHITRMKRGLYHDNVWCKVCRVFVPKIELKPGQVKHSCGFKFRTGPKTRYLKKKYDFIGY